MRAWWVGVLMAVLAVGGCANVPLTPPGAGAAPAAGGGAPPGVGAASGTPGTPPATAGDGRVGSGTDAGDARAADIAFARVMIPHHEQALELCALVPGRSSSPAVADLAFRIDRDQVEEVGQLQGFLRRLGAPPDAPRGAPGRDRHDPDAGHERRGGHEQHQGPGDHGMPGMATPATVARLRALSGPAFDRLWRDTMIAHHRGAIAMAGDLLAATGGRSTLTELARAMVVTQQAEIEALART